MAVNSFVFDEQFYLTQNPDVAAAVSAGGFASGQAHFNAFGRFEGRDPNAYFDTSFYLGLYPDVAAARVNPFEHFQANGAAEGRLFNANIDGTVDTDGDNVADEFDSAAYLAANADVAAAIPGQFASAYQHYVLFGQFEGRSGAQLTDGTALSGPYQTGSTGGGNVGQTFTLTTNTDGPGGVAPATNTNGTAANDTYLGADGTLTGADVINAGAGVDTLQFRDTSAGGVSVAPMLTSVENVNVTSVAGGTTTFNLVSSTGVTNVSSTASSQNVAFSNAKNIVALDVSNTTAGNVTLGYAPSVVTGTKDAQSITLNSATAGTVQVGAQGTAAGIETTSVTSTGSNTIASLATGATTVNLAGAGDLTVNTAIGNATTIDGSKATGSLTFAIDNTKDVTATGGSGNDTIGVSGLSAADKVDGGAGTDFVAFATTADAPATKATNLLNFEGVQVNTQGNVAGTINVDNFSGSTLNMFKIGTGAADADGITGGTLNITNGTTGSTITQFDDTGIDGTVTFALKTDGAADVLNYNLVNVDTNSGASNTHGLSNLTASTVETLNINASNQTKVGTTFENDTLTIGTLSAAAATTLKITGDSAIALGTAPGSVLTSLNTVDASAMTKNVTLGSTTQAFGTALTGATVTTGTGTDLVSLNVGNTGVLKAIDLGGQSTTSTGDTLVLSGGGVLTGATVIDLTSTTDQVSQLLGSANAAAQVGAENIDLSGLTGFAQITGTAGVNTIVGTAGGDTISAGAGNDVVTAGLGIDTVDLGAGDDTIIFNSAFAAGNANHDVISNFQFGAASADRYDIGFNVNNGLTAATSDLAALPPVAVASDGTATANDVIFTFSGAGDKLAGGTNAGNAVANAVTALQSGTDFSSANIATGDSLLLVMDNGTDSFVFHYVADGTAATTAATDLELIGVVNGQLASQVAVGDFV